LVSLFINDLDEELKKLNIGIQIGDEKVGNYTLLQFQ
jgi:hypothetical protein